MKNMDVAAYIGWRNIFTVHYNPKYQVMFPLLRQRIGKLKISCVSESFPVSYAALECVEQFHAPKTWQNFQ
jgi:hypothetical protein